MKSTQERMDLLKEFLEQTLGEIPDWYKKLRKKYDKLTDIDKKTHRQTTMATLNRVEAVLWGTLPVPESRAQLNELLSDNPEEYRINYAESLNKYHYTQLFSGKKPSLSNKVWYVACNPYDAQFFDVERYTEELREVTGNNTWCFDKVNTLNTEYGITYCFRKEMK